VTVRPTAVAVDVVVACVAVDAVGGVGGGVAVVMRQRVLVAGRLPALSGLVLAAPPGTCIDCVCVLVREVGQRQRQLVLGCVLVAFGAGVRVCVIAASELAVAVRVCVCLRQVCVCLRVVGMRVDVRMHMVTARRGRSPRSHPAQA